MCEIKRFSRKTSAMVSNVPVLLWCLDDINLGIRIKRSRINSSGVFDEVVKLLNVEPAVPNILFSLDRIDTSYSLHIGYSILP